MRSTMPLLVAFAVSTIGCFHASGGGPVVVVTASYPGAPHRWLRIPLPRRSSSRSMGSKGCCGSSPNRANDGSYVAYVRFRSRIDPDVAVVLVENRVALAMPTLPEAAKRAGIVAKIGT